MHRDSPAKRGASGPRQRSAAGHEAWLLSGAWSLGLESACHIQGYGCSIQGFGPLSLPYPGVRICPVGLNQAGRVQTSIGKMIQRADKFFAFDEFSSSRCTLVSLRDLDQNQHDFKIVKCF